MSNTQTRSAEENMDNPSTEEGFYFLDGQWRVFHRKLKAPLTGSTEWFEFEGQAKFISMLDGLVSVEELRDAEGQAIGSAMRTFDRAQRLWFDAWVSARDGILQAPQQGRFVDDEGVFLSQDVFDEKPIKVRGIWRRVNKDTVTWEQACAFGDSEDWEHNWFMRFERIF